MYESSILLKIEIISFFTFLFYVIIYSLWRIISYIYTIRKTFLLPFVSTKKDVQKVQIQKDNKSPHINNYIFKVSELSQEQKDKIQEILRRVKIAISKQDFDIAKNHIIEWLTIDKFNIELNIELSSIYLIEKDYIKAEYIYKDLLLVHEGDFDILKKLWYVLSMQEKYDLAIEIYKRRFETKDDDMEVVNMLSHLYYFKNLYVDSLPFLKIYLKQHPRDIDSLVLLAMCYKNIWKFQDAQNAFKRANEIEPYNKEIKEELEKLQNQILENN